VLKRQRTVALNDQQIIVVVLVGRCKTQTTYFIHLVLWQSVVLSICLSRSCNVQTYSRHEYCRHTCIIKI